MKIKAQTLLASTLATALLTGSMLYHPQSNLSQENQAPKIEYYELIPLDYNAEASEIEKSDTQSTEFSDVDAAKTDQTEEPTLQAVWIEESAKTPQADSLQVNTEVENEADPADSSQTEITDSAEIAALIAQINSLNSRLETVNSKAEELNTSSQAEKELPNQYLETLINQKKDLQSQIEDLELQLANLQLEETSLKESIQSLSFENIESGELPVQEQPVENDSEAIQETETNLEENADETAGFIAQNAPLDEPEQNVQNEQLLLDNQQNQQMILSQINQAQEQIAFIEESIEQTQTAVSTAASGATAGDSTYEGLSVNMPGATPNFHILNQQVKDIEARIAEIEASENPDTSKISQLQADLQSIQGTLKDMETENVYRVYNPNSGEHFYTEDAEERDYLISVGWRDEGIGWQSPKNNQEVPVYRLYNPNAGDHHYTIHADERDYLVSVGWRYESVGWYSDPWQGVQVLRVYNPNAKKAGAHHFTVSEIERDHLVDVGWNNEQVGFYSRFMYSICQETINGNTGIIYYDQNDNKLTGSQKINGYWYYFAPDTGFETTGLKQIPGTNEYRYFKADGRHATGDQNIDGSIYRFDAETGYALRDTFFKYRNNSIRYFNINGAAATASFTKDGIIFTPNASAFIVKAVVSDPVIFYQTDPRWYSQIVGYYQFGPTGCVPTTLTCIVDRLKRDNLLPTQIGQILARQGLFNIRQAGAGYTAVNYIANYYGLKMEACPNMEVAARILKAGGMICTAVNPSRFVSFGTHELLIYGYDNGYVHVHDPYTASNDGVYTLSYLYQIKSTDPTDSGNGGPFFGFYNPALNFKSE